MDVFMTSNSQPEDCMQTLCSSEEVSKSKVQNLIGMLYQGCISQQSLLACCASKSPFRIHWVNDTTNLTIHCEMHPRLGIHRSQNKRANFALDCIMCQS